MSNVENIEKIAKKHGFECIGRTTADKLNVREEVRSMCAADKCKAYNASWSCPPACGTIEHFREEIAKRNDVVVFQTVAQLEDEFDIDTMMDAAELHSERIPDFINEIREFVPDCLPLAAGACTQCDDCTYPDAPCRFPDEMFVSMEAAGLVVSDVCVAANIPYNHGQDHIAYVGCVVV